MKWLWGKEECQIHPSGRRVTLIWPVSQSNCRLPIVSGTRARVLLFISNCFCFITTREQSSVTQNLLELSKNRWGWRLSQIVPSRNTVRDSKVWKAVLGFQIQSWQVVLIISTVSGRQGGKVIEIFFIDWGCTWRKV